METISLEELCERIDGDYEVELGVMERCIVFLSNTSQFEEVLNEVLTDLDIYYSDRYSFGYQVNKNEVLVSIHDKTNKQDANLQIISTDPTRLTISKFGNMVLDLDFYDLENETELSVEIYPSSGGMTGKYQDYRTNEFLVVRNFNLR